MLLKQNRRIFFGPLQKLSLRVHHGHERKAPTGTNPAHGRRFSPTFSSPNINRLKTPEGILGSPRATLSQKYETVTGRLPTSAEQADSTDVLP